MKNLFLLLAMAVNHSAFAENQGLYQFVSASDDAYKCPKEVLVVDENFRSIPAINYNIKNCSGRKSIKLQTTKLEEKTIVHKCKTSSVNFDIYNTTSVIVSNEEAESKTFSSDGQSLTIKYKSTEKSYLGNFGLRVNDSNPYLFETLSFLKVCQYKKTNNN